jgi:hypothetical protein
MRSDTSLFLEILESLCLGIMDGILLDWIWPFGWAYFVLVEKESPKLSGHAQDG